MKISQTVSMLLRTNIISVKEAQGKEVKSKFYDIKLELNIDSEFIYDFEIIIINDIETIINDIEIIT